jgi:hypothetical protein
LSFSAISLQNNFFGHPTVFDWHCRLLSARKEYFCVTTFL